MDTIKDLHDNVAVADTSALLISGTDLLYALPKLHFIIPAIVVKELEDKRSAETVGFLAREWLRLLEALRYRHGRGLSVGVPVPDTEITLSVEPNHTNQSILPRHLQDGSNDSTILAVAENLRQEYKSDGIDKEVALLSNDVPLRLHATLDLDMEAFEVSSVTIEKVKPFTGVIDLELDDDEIDFFYGDRSGKKQVAEEAMFSAGVSHSVVHVKHKDKTLASLLASPTRPVREVPKKNKALGVTARTPEQNVALEYLLEPADIMPITSVGGSAGTGKTLLTIAAGLQGVKNEQYSKVVVFRSVHGMGVGQDIGLLPGAVEDKMAPWAGAIYDAIDVLARIHTKNGDTEAVKRKAEALRTDVEVSPIQFLRGRSIADTFVVLDEAQNFSRRELLDILARIGAGSKIVLVHDAAQVDNRYLQSGSRAEIWSVINSLKESDMFGHISLKTTERSPVAELAARIQAS